MEKFEFLSHMQAVCNAFNLIAKDTEAVIEEPNSGRSFSHDLVRAKISIGRTYIAVIEVPRYFIYETRRDVLPDPALVAATVFHHLHDERFERRRGSWAPLPHMDYPTGLIRK